MQVGYNGKIRADEAACQKASFDVEKVKKTINILGLNVERWRFARKKRWRALNKNWQNYFNDPQVIKEAARMELLPGKNNHLPRFFSTSRSYFVSYFVPVAEEILEKPPQARI